VQLQQFSERSNWQKKCAHDAEPSLANQRKKIREFSGFVE